MKISIILPCYNVEQYIAQCLQSIYAQDIPESEYEVICVNDCSPDGTRGIILEFQQKHENLILIDHKTNTMQGGARNTGLRAARGKYVWFIDSDDYIQPNCIGRLLKILDENELDILAFECDTVDERGKHIYTIRNISRQDFTTEVCRGVNFFNIEREKRWAIVFHIWKLIIKRRFLEQNGLSFYEHFHNEDVAFGMHCFLLAQRAQYLPESIVFYRQHLSSDMALREITHQGAALASYFKLTCELANMLPDLTDNEQKAVVMEYINWYQKIHIHYSRKIIGLSPAQRRIFYSKLQDIPDLHQIDAFMHERTLFALNHPRCMTVLHIILIIPIKIRQAFIIANRKRKKTVNFVL